MDNKPISKTKSNFTADVAGAGGGTLLLLLAKNLPNTSEYKSWLIILAPTLAVCLSAFWRWISKNIDDYLKERKVERLKSQLRSDIEKALKNPHIPIEQKTILREKLAAFELQNIETLTQAVASIEIE